MPLNNRKTIILRYCLGLRKGSLTIGRPTTVRLLRLQRLFILPRYFGTAVECADITLPTIVTRPVGDGPVMEVVIAYQYCNMITRRWTLLCRKELFSVRNK